MTLGHKKVLIRLSIRSDFPSLTEDPSNNRDKATPGHFIKNQRISRTSYIFR